MLKVFLGGKKDRDSSSSVKAGAGFIQHHGGAEFTQHHSGAGFTLVEVLVVIAIISLLMTILLISLGDSRDKGRDAGIKSSMLELTKASEILYSHTASYEGVCNAGSTTLSSSGDFDRINTYIIRQNGTVSCRSTESKYAIISSLNQSDCWCVDSDGDSKEVILLDIDATSCDDALKTTDCP